MLRFVVRRVATSILLLVATSALVFFVLRLLPGPRHRTSLGASPGVSARDDRPAPPRGRHRPADHHPVSELGIGGVHGDLGKSYFSQYPVSELIRNRLVATLELAFLGVPVGVFAVPGALWAARHPRGVVDTGWMDSGR